MTRLFVGSFLPEADQARVEAIRAQNAELNERWRCKVRWIKPSKLHLTWLFIGEVEDTVVPRFESALKEAVQSWRREKSVQLEIIYKKTECWPSQKFPRVLVFTPDEVSDAVYSLAQAVHEKLLPLCPKDEVNRYEKRYRPHLTAARFDFEKKRSGSAAVRLADLKLPGDLLPLAHPITNVSLIQSRLGSKEDYLPLTTIDLTSLS